MVKTAAAPKQTVAQALKQISVPQMRRFVETSDLDGLPKTLSIVRAMLHGAGGGFNQASWETIRINRQTTVDQLIKKMRSSDLMANYIRAWGWIEKASFYAYVVESNIETIGVLIDHYGEGKLYSDLVG